jgi:hypothetical protein
MRNGVKTVIAVDPGDVHVGVAIWRTGKVEAREVGAVIAVTALNRLMLASRNEGEVRLVIEDFRLYPGSAPSLSWSPMKTAEMIGALKWVAEQQGVIVTMQGADIKNPTKRQLKARGIRSTTGVSNHANDALLHLWHYVLRNGLEEV